MHFQQLLRREREMRGWSQARIAQELGTTPNTVSAWERGISLPSPYFRAKLYELFGKNALELGLLEDMPASPSVAFKQEAEVRQANSHREEAPPTPSYEKIFSIQGQPELETTNGSALTQSKQRESIFRLPAQIAHGVRGERAILGSRLSARRYLLLAVTCAALLSILGGAVLYAWSHLSMPPDPYAPYKGSLALNDPLTNQNLQVNWQEGWNANHAACQFKEGTYHAFQPLQGYFHACMAQLTSFKNFAYEVEMTLLQGNYGGIIFRAVDSIDSHYYFFRLNKDGSYMLKRYVDAVDTDAITLDTGFSQAYRRGYDQNNRLAVVADDDQLTLYVNGQDLFSLRDTAYTQGQIGVAAGSEQQAPAEASFANIRVWSW